MSTAGALPWQERDDPVVEDCSVLCSGLPFPAQPPHTQLLLPQEIGDQSLAGAFRGQGGSGVALGDSASAAPPFQTPPWVFLLPPFVHVGNDPRFPSPKDK